MKALKVTLAAVLVSAAAGATIAAAHQPRAHRTSAATLELAETGLGKIIVNSSGFTVFEFTKDKKDKDKCVTVSGCPQVWPALVASGTPTAGSGLMQSKIGTIKLSGGEEQVTYAGRPLYLYTGDSGPGETSSVGAKEFGGTWYALNAKGKKVKQAKSSGW